MRTSCLVAGCPGFAVLKGRCERHRQTTSQRGYGARWQSISRRLRDGAACVMCGSRERLAVDHVVPRSLGGSNARGNLRTLCASCHARYGVQSNRGMGGHPARAALGPTHHDAAAGAHPFDELRRR